VQILRTKEFDTWLNELRDRQGRAKILSRIIRLEEGNPGKTRSVGAGIVEMKIDLGRDTVFIMCSAAQLWLFCFVAGVRVRRKKT